MPYLGDYLGHLLAEITTARVQADLESLRVAELYASHPLLKHFPIPHVRLPTVTVDVPVVVQSMETATGAAPRGSAPVPAMRTRFGQIFDTSVAAAQIKLTPTQRTEVQKGLDQVASELVGPAELGVAIGEAADRFVRVALAPLGKAERAGAAVDAAALESLRENLASQARLAFLNLREAPPRLQVLVTTSELRQAGPSDLLARLHLSISEEGFEWTMIESAGASSARLVPE
jgi:hypothetical protein